MEVTCAECGNQFSATGARGRTPKYCSARCRKRASRARMRIPMELRDRRAWVRCVGKRPVQCDGSPASSTDPATWSSFEDVQSGAGDGFGVMLGGGLGCYDLDHCFSGGVLEDWALEVVRSIPERVVFTEVSVSGNGLHVFVEAPEGRGSRKLVGSGCVERYTRSRFIRVTGERFVR